MTTHLLGLPTDRWPEFARIVVNAAFTKITIGRSGSTSPASINRPSVAGRARRLAEHAQNLPDGGPSPR